MRILLVCHDSPHNRFYGAGLRTNALWRALGGVAGITPRIAPFDGAGWERARAALAE